MRSAAVPLLLPRCIAYLAPLVGSDEERVDEELFLSPAENGAFFLDLPHLELCNTFDELDDAIWCRNALLSDDPTKLTEVAVHRAQRRGKRGGWKAMIDLCKRNQVPCFETVGWTGLEPYCFECHIFWLPEKAMWKLEYGTTYEGNRGNFIAFFHLWQLASAVEVRDRLRGGTQAEFIVAHVRIAARRDVVQKL